MTHDERMKVLEQAERLNAQAADLVRTGDPEKFLVAKDVTELAQQLTDWALKRGPSRTETTEVDKDRQ